MHLGVKFQANRRRARPREGHQSSSPGEFLRGSSEGHPSYHSSCTQSILSLYGLAMCYVQSLTSVWSVPAIDPVYMSRKMPKFRTGEFGVKQTVMWIRATYVNVLESAVDMRYASQKLPFASRIRSFVLNFPILLLCLQGHCCYLSNGCLGNRSGLGWLPRAIA